LKTLEGPLISISPWTAKQAVLVGSHLLPSAAKSKARPQLAVLTVKIWEGEPFVSVKLRNAHPAVAVVAAVVAAVETGAAAVETDVAAVETDVAAVETDVAAAEAVAAVAGAAVSRTALETDFSRSPKIDRVSKTPCRTRFGVAR
jgi:hypothetical protein